MARRKFADPVFLLAGGPGQSAIAVAASTMALFSRLNNRRDIVFVDQRGTGGSAPLHVPGRPSTSRSPSSPIPTARSASPSQCKARAAEAAATSAARATCGLFTTSIAVQDLDAVRRALGAERIDLVGASYGTRVALEYQRQFPQAVRRSVLDGVGAARHGAAGELLARQPGRARCARSPPAPPSRRARATIPTCARASRRCSQSLPRTVKAAHPLTGRSRGVRPDARHAARRGAQRAVRAGARRGAAGGDRRRVARRVRRPGRPERDLHRRARRRGWRPACTSRSSAPRTCRGVRVSGDKPGADFGIEFARFYERLCSAWPRGDVPAAFYAWSPASRRRCWC